MGHRARASALATVALVAVLVPTTATARAPATASVRVAAPAHAQAMSGGAKTYLTWNSRAATGFVIEQATNPGMSANRRFYNIRGNDHQFTPYGLAKGRTYYFRIRALNDSTPSAYSKPVRAVRRSSEQAVSVMSYNILEAEFDGRSEGGSRVAPWSLRKYAAALLIRQANPDVIGIQEGASWVGRKRGARQVDSLRSTLGGNYRLARTEIPPSHRRYLRTGDYILYKKSTYKAVGRGGHWALGQHRWAAYQVLRNRTSGAQFLFVSAHLLVAGGAANDARRETETKRLLHKARTRAARRHVPVIYVGDFNSDQYRRHSFNGPKRAMRAAHVADAFDAAQRRTRAQYNTADHYQRTPPKNRARIDYVFAPPGVAVRWWRLVMDLRHGRFVGTIPSDHNPLVATLVIPY
jgi:endonuclease/exonuclease/phosphatase family metal-dependent hydrolase